MLGGKKLDLDELKIPPNKLLSGSGGSAGANKALRGKIFSLRYFFTDGPKTSLTHSMKFCHVMQALLLALLITFRCFF